MRLFVAICFSEAVLDAICQVRDDIGSFLSSASYTHRDNMHLTLSFLGECDVEHRNLACRAMDMLDFEPFEISMDRVGVFHRGDGDIIWLGIKKTEPLLKLHNDLEVALSKKGFVLKKENFKPHVTLARRTFPNVDMRGVPKIEDRIASVHLMLSERGRGRMVYTPLYTKNAI